MSEQDKTLEAVTPEASETKVEDGGSDSLTQEQVDKVIAQRLDREREKLKQEHSEQLQKALEDAEKKAKMSEEEREKAILAEQAHKNEQREKELTLRENKLSAIDKLIELDIPDPNKVAEFVVDLDPEKQESKLETFAQLVADVTNKKVKLQLAGKTPDKVNESDAETIEVPKSF